MHIKKKKNKTLLLLIIGLVASSTVLSTIVYNGISDGSIAKITSTIGQTDAELQPVNGNVNVNVAARDTNIDKIPKEDLIKPEPIRKEETETVPTPEVPRVVENETNPKPEIQPGEHETTIEIAGTSVRAIVSGRPAFSPTTFDTTNGIANPSGYTNITVDKIVSVNVTKELRDAVRNQALNAQGTGLLNDSAFKVITDSFNRGDTAETVGGILRNNKSTWENIVQRFGKLFDSPNVKKFLKDEAQKIYDQMIATFKSKEEKYAWLIANLDSTKFTTIGPRAEAYLKEGLALDPRNVYINEDGVIDSYSYNIPDRYNTVTSRITRDNLERRVFNYNSPYTRSAEDVRNGTYPGWTKQKIDVTSDPIFNKYKIEPNSGINVFKLERNPEVNDSLNKGYVVELDAANTKGYDKIEGLIKEFQKDGVEITSYRIFNMGRDDGGQPFRHILSALPENLPQLELFFSDRQTNTSSLIALEHKKIKELSLYTTGNSLRDSWSFNPWSLKNTSFINTLDYNVSSEYARGLEISTRITFDTIAFDEEDYSYSTQNDFRRINLGLRMVYYARNNEPFFQGRHGSGLNPDQKQGDNSYPTGLDFSRVTKIKSLRGLEFHDSQNSTNKPRLIKRLTLFNNHEAFEITTDELNNANLQHLDTNNPFEKPKIMFANGAGTRRMEIKGTNRLEQSGLDNLKKYFEYNEMLKSTREILVDPSATRLKEQLEELGYKVITESYSYT
ncbi:putative immunoglobulin-blocking virulence protein [Mycoplasma sp. HU2014]|uniref:putative immunoglobulin-blocking virulence protein n=1 Tax=Mycoplasma sp. HU2014 TaxID=1664275 RepID=UPI00067C7434|nr:putative immunoglobulin-blocking virulence protein [Mycoplasma sp. HU2014]KNG79004.1 membrane protein [Mycoplasma sp. HU2014]